MFIRRPHPPPGQLRDNTEVLPKALRIVKSDLLCYNIIKLDYVTQPACMRYYAVQHSELVYRVLG